jgi:hypothetical protein
MANNSGVIPSWVSPPIGTAPVNAAGQSVAGGFQQTSNPAQSVGISKNAGAPQPQQINPNAWDGLGQNTNANQTPAPQVSNVGQPIAGSAIGNMNLPQNVQQLLQMFTQQNGSGFQGLQQVQGNPFANLGSNVSGWGQQTSNGIYGGT